MKRERLLTNICWKYFAMAYSSYRYLRYHGEQDKIKQYMGYTNRSINKFLT